MNKENIKKILIAILIGAVVSFVTALMQGLIDALQNIQPETTGSVAGVIKYLTKWNSNPRV